MAVPADVMGAGPTGDDFLLLLTGFEGTGRRQSVGREEGG